MLVINFAKLVHIFGKLGHILWNQVTFSRNRATILVNWFTFLGNWITFSVNLVTFLNDRQWPFFCWFWSFLGWNPHSANMVSQKFDWSVPIIIDINLLNVPMCPCIDDAKNCHSQPELYTLFTLLLYALEMCCTLAILAVRLIETDWLIWKVVTILKWP